MESNEIITAQELLLLCQLRNKKVEATNLVDYTWTWKHFSYVFRLMGGVYLSDNPTQEQKFFIKEATHKYEIVKKETTNLFTFGFAFENLYLTDENKLPWYQEQSAFDLDVTKWVYRGNFRLTYPLNQREYTQMKERYP